MNLLNRYLFTQFTKNFLLVSFGFISIYLLIDFFEKIDNFTGAGKSVPYILQFFLLNIPFVLDQLGPILILLAGILTLGVLYHNNELTALKAGGIHLRHIVDPILLSGAFFTLIFLLMAQWILPKTISTTNQIWYEEVQGKVTLGVHRNNRYYSKGTEGFYSFEWPDSEQYVFRNFSYSRWNQEYNLHSLISAEWAEWKDDKWHLKNGQIQQRHVDSHYTTDVFQSKVISLPESPDHFFIPEYRSAEMSLTELFLYIFQKDREGSSTVAWTNFFGRISYIFIGLPLLVLGLPILIHSYKKWGRDLSIAVPASCGIAFLAWAVWGALQSLAKAGYLSPFFAASAIHLFFAIFGLILLRNQVR